MGRGVGGGKEKGFPGEVILSRVLSAVVFSKSLSLIIKIRTFWPIQTRCYFFNISVNQDDKPRNRCYYHLWVTNDQMETQKR